ncbi:MAG: Hsp70 family protein, partial [Atopobiaceae bacterium]|nr:Hsp70 family protein [Atopobiaceae bacterium]
IVKVTAKDKATGKSQQITISGSTALSDSEVDRMVKDAESHAAEDKAKKDEIEVRNQTDSLAYSTEQTLIELGDKVPADVRSEVQSAIDEAKQALNGTNIDAIKAASEKLQQAGYKLAQIVYSNTEAQTAQGAGGDDVVDADYEVVDDDPTVE